MKQWSDDKLKVTWFFSTSRHGKRHFSDTTSYYWDKKRTFHWKGCQTGSTFSLSNLKTGPSSVICKLPFIKCQGEHPRDVRPKTTMPSSKGGTTRTTLLLMDKDDDSVCFILLVQVCFSKPHVAACHLALLTCLPHCHKARALLLHERRVQLQTSRKPMLALVQQDVCNQHLRVFTHLNAKNALACWAFASFADLVADSISKTVAYVISWNCKNLLHLPNQGPLKTGRNMPISL